VRNAMRFNKLLVVFIVCLCMAGSASAAIIVARNGPPVLGSGAQIDGEMVGVQWHQNAAETNVQVMVYNLENQTGAEVQIQFTLYSGTAATGLLQLVLAQPFGIPAGTTVTRLLDFGTNLASLSAGDYALIASSPNYAGDPTVDLVTWLGTANPWVAETGGTIGPDLTGTDGAWVEWPGVETLNLGFVVGQDLPEPSTLLFTGAGLLLAAGLLRRRRRAS